MTSGKPGNGGNLWRDLASTVVGQLSDRVRQDGGAERGPADTGTRARPQPGIDESPAPRIASELRSLLAQGLRATNDTISDYQSERERRKVEAPMRKAQARAATAKASAIGLGVVSAAIIGSSAVGFTSSEPAVGIAPAVVGVGTAVGAVSVNRRGRRYQQEADAHARRLGAASASAVSLHGVSAYSVPLPPQGSAAYAPTRRLLAQQKALAELLPDVSEIAPELGPLAEEAERTLAGYADRIVKLERARAAAGSNRLDEPLRRAVLQYEDGVDAHQKLVEAAATVMAELVTPHVPAPAHDSINEAADRLHALAVGLREVRSDQPLAATDGPLIDASGMPSASAAQLRPRPSVRRNRRGDLAG